MLAYCFPKTVNEVNAVLMSKLAFTWVKFQYVIINQENFWNVSCFGTNQMQVETVKGNRNKL